VVWWVGTIPKISSCELEPDEKMDLRWKICELLLQEMALRAT
jgi:hypothetical protein